LMWSVYCTNMITVFSTSGPLITRWL